MNAKKVRAPRIRYPRTCPIQRYNQPVKIRDENAYEKAIIKILKKNGGWIEDLLIWEYLMCRRDRKESVSYPSFFDIRSILLKLTQERVLEKEFYQESFHYRINKKNVLE